MPDRTEAEVEAGAKRRSPALGHGLRSKLAVARSLSIQDWLGLARAWLLILAIDLRLRRGENGLTALQAWTSAPLRRPSMAAESLRSVQPPEDPVARLDRRVDIAARNHLWPMTCLRRSLLLQRLLAERGVATDLQLGVLREADGLTAHAWLIGEQGPVGSEARRAADFAALGRLDALDAPGASPIAEA
jgi:hypothetical protein